MPSLQSDFRWIKGVTVELKGGRSNDKLELVIVADSKTKFKYESNEPIQSTPGQRFACQQRRLPTILLYELKRFREKDCIMRIDAPLVDTETYDDAPRIYETDRATVTLTFSYSRGGADREAVEAAKGIVKHQDVILDKLENVRWFFARIKDVGDSVKEIHPYVESAVNALFLLYSLCEQQEKCRNAARDLIEELDTFLEYGYEEIRDVLEARQDTQKAVENMARLLTQISDYIIKNNKGVWKSLSRDAFSSRYETEISAFKNEFRRAKEALGHSIQFGIWKRVVDTALKTKLESVTRAHYSSGEGCLENTRKTLLADVDIWVRESDEKIAWVYGHAGSGKSALLNSIAEGLESAGIPFSCFACKRDDTERSDIHRVLPTISYSFAEYYGDYRGTVSGVAEKPAGQAVLTGDVKKQIELLFGENCEMVNPKVSSHCSRPSVHVILIDALDESRNHRDESKTSHERSAILRFFLSLANSTSWIKVLITSRPEPDIVKVLEQSTCPSIHRIDINDDKWKTSDDVRTFIETKARQLELELSPNQVGRLCDKASGLFVWCTTVFKYVEKRRRPGSDTIDIILNSTSKANDKPLAPLYNLYQQVLDSAVEDDEDRSLMESILGTIFVAATRKPLSVNAIADLVFPEAVDSDQVSKNRNWVANMVEYLSAILFIEKETNIVRTSHPSVLDFTELGLLAAERVSSSVKPFSASLQERHELMFGACLTIMSRDLRFNICELEDSTLLNKDVFDLSARIDRYIQEALQYGSLFWLSHLEHSKSKQCAERVLAFLNSRKALFWIEVQSLLNTVDHGVVILQDCARYFKDEPNIIELVSDWERLLLGYGDALQSTPHLYLSALSWVPERSRLREIISGSFSAQLSIITNIAKTWGGERWSENIGTPAQSVAYSPDGRLFAAGCWDGSLHLWEARSGKKAGKTRETGSVISSIAFSPDSQWIASGQYGGEIKLWDLRADTTTNADTMKVLVGHTSIITSVAFSSDGKRVASGSYDKSISIWDIETGERLVLEGHANILKSVTFSADDELVISGSWDKTMRIWNSKTGEQIGELRHPRLVHSVACSRDGRFIASGSRDTIVRVWDAQNYTQSGEPLMGHIDDVKSVCFSSKSNYIASGSDDRSIRVWSVDTRSLVCELRGHTDEIRAVTFSPDEQSLLSSSNDGTVRIWDFKVSGESSSGRPAPVVCVSCNPDGSIIASGSSDGKIHLWDAKTGAAVREPLRGHTDPVNTITFFNDGISLVSGSDDESLRIWDTVTGATSGEPMLGHTGRIDSVAVSPDNRLIASASYDNTVRLWDVATRKLVVTLEGHDGGVNAVVFSVDGQWVISGSEDQTIRVWDSRTGETIGQPLRLHLNSVQSVAVSPDGSWIASSSTDATVQIWSTSTLSRVLMIDAHLLTATSVTFSLNSKYVISGSFDETVRVWDVQTGKMVGKPLKGHADSVNSIAPSSNSYEIVSGSKDGTIRVWDIRARADLELYNSNEDMLSNLRVSDHDEVLRIRWNASRAHLGESDGWVREGGNLLLWVPVQYRRDVQDAVRLVIGAHVKDRVRPMVDYRKVFRYSGTRWKDIYQTSG